MKNRLLFGALLLMNICLISAQSMSPKISFEKMVYDFGEIKEDGGKVSGVFKFTNVGAKPLTIQNVKASCGCTTPQYTKKPVPPGGTGTVTAIYDPLHRPGSFNKSITVTTNGTPGRVTLHIVGEVLRKAKSLKEQYPYEWGDVLRLKNIHFNVATLNTTEVKTKSIEVINVSETETVELELYNIPKHLKVSVNPKTIKPQQKGIVTLVYDASKKNDFDYVRDWFFAKVNGKKDSRYRFVVSAKIRENFNSMSDAERAKAAVATYPETVFDFKTIKEGDKVLRDFVIKNNGQSNLIIRKVKSSCGCTVATPKKKLLAPGEETILEAKFDSKGRHGNVYKTITVVTNSPSNSSQTLVLKGKIE